MCSALVMIQEAITHTPAHNTCLQTACARQGSDSDCYIAPPSTCTTCTVLAAPASRLAGVDGGAAAAAGAGPPPWRSSGAADMPRPCEMGAEHTAADPMADGLADPATAERSGGERGKGQSWIRSPLGLSVWQGFPLTLTVCALRCGGQVEAWRPQVGLRTIADVDCRQVTAGQQRRGCWCWRRGGGEGGGGGGGGDGRGRLLHVGGGLGGLVELLAHIAEKVVVVRKRWVAWKGEGEGAGVELG